MMDDPRDALRPPHYLREWREAHGYSLSDMAARTPFGKSTLSRVETGKISYYAEILEAYALVIGCQPYVLLQRPPGGPEELFAVIDHMIADRVYDDPRDAKRITKILLKQR